MSDIDPELRRTFRRMPRLVLGPTSTRLLRWLVGFSSAKPDTDGLTVGEVATPGASTSMVIYRRSDSKAPAPVVFWIHGGGFIMGSNKTEDCWGEAFCRSIDCVVVAAGYRLAPEHRFPSALDDLRAAMGWVLDHGASHGLDPDTVIIGGESAGGGLAAALVQRLHDEGVTIRGQLLACPMLDDRTAVRPDIGRREPRGWNNGSNYFGWSSYLGTEPGGDTAPEYAVPARREQLAGLPPAWIGVGDVDLFYDEDLEYADRLREAGVPVTLEVARGGAHGYHRLVPKASVSKRFIASAVDFAAVSLAS
ncbi:MAG: alpha/beta hydrolase [Acidimicrobiia bacterium]|nr:alpha/beta hydrolase [Acidimicrobiia bacterium]